tara:strand:- start:20 stop:703 length:684 start_codon:yes stop_codon:yes gene_type:complete
MLSENQYKIFNDLVMSLDKRIRRYRDSHATSGEFESWHQEMLYKRSLTVGNGELFQLFGDAYLKTAIEREPDKKWNEFLGRQVVALMIIFSGWDEYSPESFMAAILIFLAFFIRSDGTFLGTYDEQARAETIPRFFERLRAYAPETPEDDLFNTRFAFTSTAQYAVDALYKAGGDVNAFLGRIHRERTPWERPSFRHRPSSDDPSSDEQTPNRRRQRTEGPTLDFDE